MFVVTERKPTSSQPTKPTPYYVVVIYVLCVSLLLNMVLLVFLINPINISIFSSHKRPKIPAVAQVLAS
jgi:hypothetical protein